jgi:hypothetical protein
MPGSEHLSWADESVWGTFVAPDHAMPVTSSGINPTQALMVNADTGGGRGRRPGVLGAKTIEGPITTGLYGRSLGYLLRTMYATRAKTTAGTGFRNKLLVDDDVDQGSLSMQKRYKDTLAESIRGAKLNGYTVTARSREYATVETRWLAKDAAANGGTWADGTSAPAVVDPVPYDLLEPDKLKFDEGALYLGGTKALTSGEIVITGGTERCEFDNIQLAIDNGLSNDAFGVCMGDPTVQDIIEGTRAITLRFEPNIDAVDAEFYTEWGSGTDLSAVLKFISKSTFDTGQYYEFWWALPLVRLSAAPFPELNTARGLKRQTVEAMAFADPSLAGQPDHGLVIKTSEDLTV